MLNLMKEGLNSVLRNNGRGQHLAYTNLGCANVLVAGVIRITLSASF